MDIDTIERRLDELGVTMTANGNRLDLRPGSRVPEDLQVAVRLHKLDLIDRLPTQLPDDSELAEIVRQVKENGYVLLWSNVLHDLVAFVQSDEDANSVPRHFTIYTVAELVEIFVDETPSPGALKLIHQAKKYGGRISRREVAAPPIRSKRRMVIFVNGNRQRIRVFTPGAPKDIHSESP